jgi:hypothetical protein
MSDVAAPQQFAEQTREIVRRLAGLRSQINLWFVVDGLVRVLWTMLAVFAVDCLLDWCFRMDHAQRVVMLVMMAAVLISAVYRWLIAPLLAVAGDDALCLQVEQKHPELQQSLISALQFAREPDHSSRGYSLTLVAATVRQGAEAALGVSFPAVLDSQIFGRNLALLLCALLCYLGAAGAIAANPLANIWFNRNLLLGDQNWPQLTYLELLRAKDGVVVFPRGEDWTQHVEVTADSQIVPSAVTLEFRRARGRSSQLMKKAGERRFEAVFASVMEPFEFRARGGDALTPWVRVELVEPPAFEQLELVVAPPAYTQQSPQTLPPGRGPYFALPGSTLTISGQANKPLASAVVEIEGHPQPIPLRVTGGLTVRGAVAPDQLLAGQYVLRLTDESGLTSKRPATFGMRIRPDREPRVRVRLVGVSGMVTPRARLPFSCRATDDYGVADLKVDYRWTGDDVTRPKDEGAIPFPDLKSKLPRPELTYDARLDLESLAIPTGSGLTFAFVAADNDNINPLGANVGRSSDFLVRVVTEDELRADLLRREKEQRQEFERYLKLQEDLLTELRAWQAGAGDSAALSGEQRDLLMQMQKRQKVLGVNVGAVGERMALFLIEVENNRLEESDGKLQARLQEIVTPLQELSSADLPAIVVALDQVRRESGPARSTAAVAAVQQQEQAIEKMRRVLSLMVKSEGYQEAINLIYEIQKSQQDVLDRTMKEQQERIKRILEGAKPSGASQPVPPNQSGDSKP